MSEVDVPCLGFPCRVADCARATPGRQALSWRRARRNRKQTVPWICELDLLSIPATCRVETRWSPGCASQEAGTVSSVSTLDDDGVETVDSTVS